MLNRVLYSGVVLFFLCRAVVAEGTEGEGQCLIMGSPFPYSGEEYKGVNTLILKSREFRDSDSDSALYYAKEAAHEANLLKDIVVKAHVNTYIGSLLDKQGNFRMAIEYLHDGLKVYEDLGMKEQEAIVRLQLGRTAADAMHFDLSLVVLEEAASLFTELSDVKQLACTFTNVAYTHERSGNSELALAFYRKADSLNAKLNDPGLMKAITEGYGSVYEDLGEYEKALSYYQKVYPLYQDDLYDRIDIINNIGDIYRKTGNPQRALGYYEAAFALAEGANITRKIQQNLLDLALTYEALGRDKTALEYYKEHLTLFNKFYDEKSASQINQLLILHEAERKNKALEIERLKANTRTLQRNVVTVGLIIFVVVAIVLLILIRQKIQANRKLNEQNEQIKNARDQLVYSEKMASVGTLAAGIAHEINNPMNFILGGVSAIDSYCANNFSDHKERLHPLFESIYTGVDRTSKIIRSLNHFSRQSDEMDELCDIHGILDNCLVMLKYSTKERIEIQKNYTGGYFKCKGNEGNLHQVFLNVLVNAIQAIEDKGHISIETTREKNNLVIRIQDDGNGIEQAHILKVTDPFFTTKEVGQGTGLGLSISNKIISNHKGSLKFTSEAGRGTTVTICLPGMEDGFF